MFGEKVCLVVSVPMAGVWLGVLGTATVSLVSISVNMFETTQTIKYTGVQA